MHLVGETRDTAKKKDVFDDPADAQRREKVKDAMRHAWSSYEKYAWGHDELQVRFLFSYSNHFIKM